MTQIFLQVTFNDRGALSSQFVALPMTFLWDTQRNISKAKHSRQYLAPVELFRISTVLATENNGLVPKSRLKINFIACYPKSFLNLAVIRSKTFALHTGHFHNDYLQEPPGYCSRNPAENMSLFIPPAAPTPTGWAEKPPQTIFYTRS